MKKKSVNLPQKVKSALNDLKLAEKQAGQLVTDTPSNLFLPDENLINKIKQEIKAADWTIKTTNKISGGIKQNIFSIIFETEFDCEISNLIESFNNQNDPINEYTNNETNISQELSQIMTESLKPKSNGLSKNIKVLEWPKVDIFNSRESTFTKNTWPLKLTLDNDLIRFDYTNMFNYIFGNIYIISQKKFADEIWIPVDFFQIGKQFSHTFHLEETGLIVSINAEFKPL